MSPTGARRGTVRAVLLLALGIGAAGAGWWWSGSAHFPAATSGSGTANAAAAARGRPREALRPDPALVELEREGEFALAIARVESLRTVAATGRDARLESELLVVLGRLHVAQGTNAIAIERLEEAVRRYRAGSNADDLPLAEALVTLGVARKNHGLYSAASEAHGAALEIAKRSGSAGESIAARALAGAANVIRVRGSERARALAMLADAVRMGERAMDPESIDLASLRTNLALVLLQLEQPEQALEQTRRSLPAQRRQLGAAHPSLGLTLAVEGQALLMTGRASEAEGALRESAHINRRSRTRSWQGTNRLRYRPTVFGALAASLVEQGRGDEAWRVLDDGLSLFGSERMRQAAGTAVQAVSPGAPRRDVELHGRGRGLGLRADVAVIGWLDVSFVNEHPWKSWVYLLRGNEPVRWIPLETPGREHSRHGMSLVRASLTSQIHAASRWPLRVSDAERLRLDARSVWAERFAPLEPHLDGVRDLIMLMPGPVNGAPIECWVDDRGRALVERFRVVYAPSVELLDRLALRRARRSDAIWILGPSGVRKPSSPAGTTRDMGPGSLQGAVREALHLKRLRSDAVLLRDEHELHAALHESAARGGVAEVGILHLAGHVVGNPALPGFDAFVLDAAETPDRDRVLALAAGPTPSSSRDGILTSPEIEDLPLDADLVCLSACATRGREDYGGFVGVAEAFLHGRAKSVLVSLWPVDDRATSRLMALFYEEYLSASDPGFEPSRAEALRRAKLRLREERDESGARPFEHPSYWAAFVLLGDPGRSLRR